MADPASPYVVDVFGIRERHPGEPPQLQMSSEARWERFECGRACKAIAQVAILIGELPEPVKLDRRHAA